MSYSAVLPTSTVARKGAKPTDLPAEQPTKFELLINLKTARPLGLTERGWAKGRGFWIEQRSAEGDLERLPGLVAELIGIGVTVIVTGLGTPAALATKRATAKIPIVFVTGGDPVDFGIVSHRAKPGGNITGFGGGITAIQKRLDLLREVSPGVKRVAFLRNLTNAVHPQIFSAVERAGGQLGLTLHEVGVFEATEFEGVFKTMQSSRFDALFVPGDAMFSHHRALLIDLAAKTRLPAIYGDRLFPDGGGLMSFSVDLVELCRRAAGHVDRILRGAPAGDLPVEEAVKFGVIINVRAAPALGLMIPASLRQRAGMVEPP
jgi:putative tryptophan/tyrosine transport system substrate-binding protein